MSNIDKKYLQAKRKRSENNEEENESNLTHKSSKSLKTKNSKVELKKVDKNQKSLLEEAIIKQSLMQKPILKTSCNICSSDISNSMRVIGKSLKEYCFDCLFSLKVTENYHIIDKLNFSIFNSDWTLKEELQLLTCIEKYGLDNWSDIANILKSKPKILCESHYYSYYLRSLNNPLPTQDDVILFKTSPEPNVNNQTNKENQAREEEFKNEIMKRPGVIPENIINKENKNNGRSRSLVKNRNRKDQKNITTAEEIVGYWPKREEFDVEFLNEAEIEIAELEFLDDDSPEDIELKLQVLQIYNMQLAERESRKKFIIERGLLDIKKQLAYEKKLSKDDREIYNCLKPFARFLSVEEFNELFEGLVLEKNLRQRLNQLKAYQEMGYETLEEVEKSLDVEQNRKNREASKTLYDNLGLSSKTDKEANTSIQSDLTIIEKDFIKKMNISKELYLDIKTKIPKESKNSLKTSIIQNFNTSKDEIDQVYDFILKIKK